jgi:hypothetical protein
MAQTLKAFGLKLEDTRNLLGEVSSKLTSSSDLAEKALGSVLSGDVTLIVRQQRNYEPPLEETLSLLGMATTAQKTLIERHLFFEAPKNYEFKDEFPRQFAHLGREFLTSIFKEIRDLICGKSEQYRELQKKYKSYPYAFAVSVSAVVLRELHVSEPMAMGIASLCLLTLAQVTRNAFCRMTDAEFGAAVDKKLAEEMAKEKAKEAAVNKKRAKIEKKEAAGKNLGKRVHPSRNRSKAIRGDSDDRPSRPRSRA